MNTETAKDDAVGQSRSTVGLGPITTDQRGELDIPIKMCAWDGYRCKHFDIHDWHYFYCSAQDAENQHKTKEQYAYPWHGAGKCLHDNKPDAGCPFNTPNAQIQPRR